VVPPSPTAHEVRQAWDPVEAAFAVAEGAGELGLDA
jgi:hypothetical protein